MVRYIDANKKTKPIGYCSRYTKKAIYNGLVPPLKLPYNSAHAFEMIAYLPTIGWKAIGNNLPKEKWEVGDVAVFPQYSGGPYGHICMWTGSSWISDFKQLTIYPTSRRQNLPYVIFRAINRRNISGIVSTLGKDATASTDSNTPEQPATGYASAVSENTSGASLGILNNLSFDFVKNLAKNVFGISISTPTSAEGEQVTEGSSGSTGSYTNTNYGSDIGTPSHLKGAELSSWNKVLEHDKQFGFAQLESQAGLPRGLLAAVEWQESRGNPNAKSPVGASGAFQFMPATAKDFGLSNPTDIAASAAAAAKYLGNMNKKFGSVELALAGYNAGPGNVQKHGNTIPPFKETQNYVTNIMKNLRSSANGTPQTVENPEKSQSVASSTQKTVSESQTTQTVSVNNQSIATPEKMTDTPKIPIINTMMEKINESKIMQMIQQNQQSFNMNTTNVNNTNHEKHNQYVSLFALDSKDMAG